MIKNLIVLCLVLCILGSCENITYSTTALCDDPDAAIDTSIDSQELDAPDFLDAPNLDAFQPDAQVTCPITNPNPVFTDTTGQGHLTVTLAAPSNYAATSCTPKPLLLYLNGYKGDGGSIKGKFLHDGIENTQNVLTIAPTGIVGSTGFRRWNATGACCEPVQPANNDVLYLTNLIERVITAGWNVDTNRIYVLGMSNGGFMALRLLCERPDLITGVVAIAASGLSGTDITCTGGGHIALSHSKADSSILYNGGTMNLPPVMPIAYPAIETAGGTIDQLKTRNACTGPLQLIQLNKYDFDHAAGYPENIKETDLMEVSNCPSNKTITLWRAPYLSPTYGHSIHATPEFGQTVIDWVNTHPRNL